MMRNNNTVSTVQLRAALAEAISENAKTYETKSVNMSQLLQQVRKDDTQRGSLALDLTKGSPADYLAQRKPVLQERYAKALSELLSFENKNSVTIEKIEKSLFSKDNESQFRFCFRSDAAYPNADFFKERVRTLESLCDDLLEMQKCHRVLHVAVYETYPYIGGNIKNMTPIVTLSRDSAKLLTNYAQIRNASIDAKAVHDRVSQAIDAVDACHTAQTSLDELLEIANLADEPAFRAALSAKGDILDKALKIHAPQTSGEVPRFLQDILGVSETTVSLQNYVCILLSLSEKGIYVKTNELQRYILDYIMKSVENNAAFSSTVSCSSAKLDLPDIARMLADLVKANVLDQGVVLQEIRKYATVLFSEEFFRHFLARCDNCHDQLDQKNSVNDLCRNLYYALYANYLILRSQSIGSDSAVYLNKIKSLIESSEDDSSIVLAIRGIANKIRADAGVGGIFKQKKCAFLNQALQVVLNDHPIINNAVDVEDVLGTLTAKQLEPAETPMTVALAIYPEVHDESARVNTLTVLQIANAPELTVATAIGEASSSTSPNLVYEAEAITSLSDAQLMARFNVMRDDEMRRRLDQVAEDATGEEVPARRQVLA